MEPKDHQNDCLDAIHQQRSQEKNNKALVVGAPGIGKTVIAAHDVKRFINNLSSPKVLYLCNQNDVLHQAKLTFQSITNEEEMKFGFLNGVEKNINAKYLFASFQTMQNKKEYFNAENFDYIVVDEAHHTPADTYLPVVQYFKPKFLLGLTATPDRMDLRDVKEIFGGKETYSLPLEEAMVLGLLVKVNYKLIADEFTSLGEIKNPCRLSIEDLNTKYFIPKRDEEIKRIIFDNIKEMKDPRVIIFCPSIKYAVRFSKLLSSNTVVHSKLSRNVQNERINDFRNGKVNIIFTVDKFNEGIDIPETNVVVFLRSTTSPGLYYQQLGRGLRKSPGKEKLLVLDFVANCERVQLVYDLIQKIKVAKQKFMGNKSSHKKSEPIFEEDHDLVFDFGEFNFSEKALQLIDILKKISTGYTQESLILSLKNLAKDLGKNPTRKEVDAISKKGQGPSSGSYKMAFGSFNDALIASDLKVNKIISYSKEEIIKQLKDLATKLGRTPELRDVKKASKGELIAGTTCIVNVFGSFNNAIKAAELEVTREVNLYTEQILIDQLKALEKELGRTPKTRDIQKKSTENKMASPSTFVLFFGTTNDALKAAGLKPSRVWS